MRNRKKQSKKPNSTIKEQSGFQNGDVDKERKPEMAKKAGNGTTQHESRSKYCTVSLVGVLKFLLIIIIVPPLLNYASLQREARSLSPEGEVKISPKFEHKLFVNCKGRGQPVVIMDTPEGTSSDIWSLVHPEVAKFTKVCVYDRVGLGFSERHLHKLEWNASNDDIIRNRWQPTSEHMAEDIHFLVNSVANDSAVVLVGGGLGGVNVRFYAQMFQNVFGLVLVNAFHEDMFANESYDWEEFWYENHIPSLQLQQILAATGITRLGLLSGFIKTSVLSDIRLSDNFKIRHKYFLCNSMHLMTGLGEHYYLNESLTQVKMLQKVKPFPEGILVNIISSESFGLRISKSLNEFWFKSQDMLKENVFPRSERILAKGDFNSVYFDDSTVIVETIQKLVNKFRRSVKQSANI